MIEREMDTRLRDVEIKLGQVMQRVEDHEGDIRSFGALPNELHEIRWEQGKMRESLDAAHDAVRELSGKLDREHEERIVSLAERKAEIEEATATRNKQIQELRDRDEQRKLENRRMLIGLLGIFLTAAAGVLAPVLGGGGM